MSLKFVILMTFSLWARLILFSDWLMLKKSSPLKQLGQMEPSLAGSIYVRSKPGIDGEDFFNISQSEKRINLAGHFVGRIEPNEEAL
jgi:hypothetical protein